MPPPLSKAVGQPVMVENKVGAAGNIAADAVTKASDDQTIGRMINGNMTIAKLRNPKLSYDPLKDLTPVSLRGVSPLVLTAPTNAPGNNAAEFLAAARASGDKWNYGTAGVGTVGHIGMERLKAIGITASVRRALVPEMPSLSETGWNTLTWKSGTL